MKSIKAIQNQLNNLIYRKDYLLLLCIFISALFLRGYGINFDLPYVDGSSDEPFYVLHALKFGTGDFNPHWFLYPTFYMYILFFIYSMYFVLGWIFDIFQSTRDFVVLYFTDPSSFYLIGRFTTALLGSLTVITMYPIGKKLFNQRVGILASFFLAFTFLHIRDSHIIKADIPMTFLLMLSFYFAVRMLQEGRNRYYMLTGLIGGLAVGAKYNAVFFIFFLITAHILNSIENEKTFKEILLSRKLLSGFIASLTGFLIAVPYAFLDYKTFYQFLNAQFIQSKAGWIGDSSHINMHLKIITVFLKKGMGTSLLLLSLIGIVYSLFRHKKAGILIVSFPLVYFIVIGGSKLNFDRYWNPVLPFLVLTGASLLLDIISKFNMRQQIQNSILSILAITFVAFPIYEAMQYNRFILQKDSRIIAKEWIEENISVRSKIAMDIDGPPISQNREGVRAQFMSKLQESIERPEARSYKLTPAEPEKNLREYYNILLTVPITEPSYYVIRESPSVANKSLEYYEKNNFEYIIINESTGTLFFNNPDKYPAVADFYKNLKNKYRTIKEFRTGVTHKRGPEILIYKIKENIKPVQNKFLDK